MIKISIDVQAFQVSCGGNTNPHGVYSADVCLQLNCGQTCQRRRLGENVTLQMRDWQEAIDFFADIPAAEIDMHHFAQEPVP